MNIQKTQNFQTSNYTRNNQQQSFKGFIVTSKATAAKYSQLLKPWEYLSGIKRNYIGKIIGDYSIFKFEEKHTDIETAIIRKLKKSKEKFTYTSNESKTSILSFAKDSLKQLT